MTSYLLSAKAVLFDCDGVLVDSDESVDKAWARWADRYGLEARQVAALVHGRRTSDTVDLLIEPAARAEALATINAYELDDAASVTAVCGAPELVASVPSGAWAVVTSGTPTLASARLEAAGIATPTVFVTADDVGRGKPAPDGYLAAAAALGLPPADTVVVEDSVTGIEAGRLAGVAAVLGVGTRALDGDADIVVQDLESVTWAEGLRIHRRTTLRGPSPTD